MTKDGGTETRLRESGQNGEECRLDLLERHEVVNITLDKVPVLVNEAVIAISLEEASG